MSFLAPLFALGFLAIAAPIVFHLIRRRPQGRVDFSSLMFLSPSPPKLSRHSRLEHILLLLLRASALGLLAFAFMRPFFRTETPLDLGDGGGRRIAVLIDASASMRRGDLWEQALARADAVLADAHPTDQVGVFVFDSASRPLLDFGEGATLDPSQRTALARGRLRQLAPTWGGTDLGRALVDALDALQTGGGSASAGAKRIVLVSDLQQGARLEALAGHEWPTDVELDLQTVSVAGGNAGLALLADRVEDDRPGAKAELRIRVVNDVSSSQERFALAWVDANGTASAPIEAYVPPGESRVVRVPRPDGTGKRTLRLTGDDHDFDDTLHVPTPRREEATVVYVGPDGPGEPNGLRYFLERALGDAPGRTIHLAALKPSEAIAWDTLRPAPLVVATGESSPANAALLRRYVQEGGTLLYVVTAAGRAETLAALADVPPWEIEEARVDRYALLREIDFGHPMFAPLAGPQFGDFTKVSFWKHRRIDDARLGDSRVIARFEDGDPAVIEKTVGAGRLVVFTSGWQPVDSQLARSSKFVPLTTELLERRLRRGPLTSSFHVGDRVPLPTAEGTSEPLVVRRPDGSTATLPAGTSHFDGTEQPGVYAVESAGGAGQFAVNVDPAESKTSPLPVETLEQMGCRIAKKNPEVVDPERQRQMRDVELESRQKSWRWLVLAAFAVLLVETWLAGRLSSRLRDPTPPPGPLPEAGRGSRTG